MKKIILPETDSDLLSACKVETFRSSGSGGQHVNKTDSAVRLTYLPENIVVTCQEYRSQLANKNRCLQKLRDIVAKMNYRPPRRIPTKKPRSKKEEVLKKKARHGEKKLLRRKVNFND